MTNGFYCVTNNLPKPERRRAQWDALLRTAANNLDTLYTQYLWLQPAERGHQPAWDDQRWALYLLREAQRRGVRLILEDVRDLPAEVRRQLAAHPALASFGVADDANGKTDAELAAACDPREATGTARYISIGASADQPNARCYGLSEQIGVQIYPYQFADSNPKTQPSESLRDYWPVMVEARKNADLHNQMWIANLQIHRNYSERHPTPEQVEALAWAAKAAGADGALWYAILDNDPAGAMWAPAELIDAVRDVTAATRLTPGRPASCTLDGAVLTASWPGGTRVQVDLAANQVLSVQTGPVTP